VPYGSVDTVRVFFVDKKFCEICRGPDEVPRVRKSLGYKYQYKIIRIATHLGEPVL
jgi:hypothetical protein